MDPSSNQIDSSSIRRSDCKAAHIPDDLFKSLSLCRKALINPILWDEFLILDRLCYKNQNQHRSADYFRKMKHVQRHLRKLKAADFGSQIKTFSNEMLSDKKMNPKDWDQLPSKGFIQNTSHRLLQTYALIDSTVTCTMNAYSSFRCQVQQTYFMSTSLVAMSCLARIHYCLKGILIEMRTTYKVLKKVLLAVPNDPTAMALNMPGAALGISEFTKWKFEVDVLETGGHVSSSDSDGEEPEGNLKSGSPLPVTTSDTPTEPQLRSISDSFWMSMSAPVASPGPNSSSPVEETKSSPKKKVKKNKKSGSSVIDDIFSQLG